MIECEDDNPAAPDYISFTQELSVLADAVDEWLNVSHTEGPIERYGQAALRYFGDNPPSNPRLLSIRNTY